MKEIPVKEHLSWMEDMRGRLNAVYSNLNKIGEAECATSVLASIGKFDRRIAIIKDAAKKQVSWSEG